MLKPLTLWITTNWKIVKEMGIPDHLTCLLRNLFVRQEATVRTKHGTMDWFHIGKGVHRGISSSTLSTWWKELIHWKRPWCCKRLKAGGEGDDRGWDAWMVSLTQGHKFEQALEDGEVQGSLTCCSPWGCKESDMTELNWTDILGERERLHSYISYDSIFLYLFYFFISYY